MVCCVRHLILCPVSSSGKVQSFRHWSVNLIADFTVAHQEKTQENKDLFRSDSSMELLVVFFFFFGRGTFSLLIIKTDAKYLITKM